jgi:hypothetical protein
MKKLVSLSPSNIEIVMNLAKKITRRGQHNFSKALNFIIENYEKEKK